MHYCIGRNRVADCPNHAATPATESFFLTLGSGGFIMAVAFGVAVSVALLRKFLLVRKTKDSSDNKTISSFLRVVLVRHG